MTGGQAQPIADDTPRAITVANATEFDVWPDGCPHPPEVRDEIFRVARTISAEDVQRSGYSFAPWYTRFFLAEGKVLARAQAAKDQQAQEVRELRQRVRKLEAIVAPRGPLMSGIGKALGTVRTEIANKLEAVEANQLRFLGVHEPGRAYKANSLVVKRGGLWCALGDTTRAPGTTDWQLVTKAGEIGREPVVR